MSLALALFVACKGPDGDSSVDSNPPDETDVAETTLRVTTDEAAFDDATLGLFQLDTTFFAVLSETPVQTVQRMDGAFELAFTPDDAALVEAPWAPGLRVAGYALVAYRDEPDANGLVGITRFDAVWFDGTVPEPYAALGLHEGWNALRADDEGPPTLSDPLALTLETNLLPAASASASGTWDVPIEGRVAGFATEDATFAIGAVAAADPWSVAASEDPPASTWFDGGDVTVAGFRLGAFADADTDGAWSTGDTVSAVAVTVQDEPAWLAWGAPVASAHEAHVLVTRGGFRVGWSVVRGTEGSTPLGPSDSLRMVAGAL